MRKFFLSLIALLVPEIVNATIYEVVGTDVLNGGILNANDTQNVHGVVNRYLIEGTQNIYDYGTAYYNNIVNLGQQNVYSGGRSLNSSVFGGIINGLGGEISDVTLNGGTINLEKGRANNFVVASGNLNIFSTAVLNGLEAVGGDISLYKGGTIENDISLQNSTLKIMGDNRLESLKMQSGVIELIPINNIPSKLEVNDLQGNGRIDIRTNFANGDNEVLKIGQGNGNFGLSIIDIGSGENIAEHITLLPKNSANQENLYLVGGELDIGAKKYILQEDNASWFLQQTLTPTDTAIIAKDTYATMSSVLYSHMNGIYSRQGEFRRNLESGIWVKGLGQKIKFDLNHNSKTEVDIYGVQLGADYALKINGFKNINIGVGVGYSDSKYNFDVYGQGDGESYSTSIYSTLLMYNNSYIDLVAGYYWHKQKNKSYVPSGLQVNSKYNLNAYILSVEIGRRFGFKDGYFIEPQMQISYMNVDDVDYMTSLNTKVKGLGLDSMMGRIGLMLGKNWQGKGEVYFSAGLIKEFDTKTKIKVADVVFNEELDETLLQFGIGTDLQLTNKARFYADVATTLGDDIKVPIEGNLGIIHHF